MQNPTVYQLELDSLMPIIREQLAAGQSVRFSPRGISMLPMLRQGKDAVLISPVTGMLKKYDLPLYRRDDGKYILHRIVAVSDTYTCCGDNQTTLETGVRHDQIIAVVTAFYRGNRSFSSDFFLYKLYARCWVAARRPRAFAFCRICEFTTQ